MKGPNLMVRLDNVFFLKTNKISLVTDCEILRRKKYFEIEMQIF